MRTYGQYCSVAKALDVIGDRWTLLIIRELLLAGSARYTDLRNGLPGIATNLLAERLRELEASGIISREEAPPPVATSLFRLTPRGEGLRSTIDELARWGIPLMAEGPADGDRFREQWLTGPAELFLSDHRPEDPPVAIELLAAERPMVIEASRGEVRVRRGPADAPDAVLRGPPYPMLGLLSGSLDMRSALAMGLELEGDRGALERVLPEGPPAGAVESEARAQAPPRSTGSPSL